MFSVNPTFNSNKNGLHVGRDASLQDVERGGLGFPSHILADAEKLQSAVTESPRPFGRLTVIVSAAIFFVLVGMGMGIGVGSAIFMPPPMESPIDPSTLPTDTSISEINLNIASLAVGTPVSVRGIVVWDGRRTTLRGFYLQTPQGTTTPLGSEAIFVSCSTGSLCTSTSFGEGSDVQVNGTVSSSVDRGDTILKPRITQNNVNQLKVFCNTPTITLTKDGPKYCSRVRVRQIRFPLPAQNANQVMLENLGMLVEIIGAQKSEMTVINNQNLARHGELGLSSHGLLYSPTMIAAPGDAAKAVEEENKRKEIVLDDANFANDARPTLYPEGGIADSASSTLRVGYTIPTTRLRGLVVLDRRNLKWRLQPNEMGRQVIPSSFNIPESKKRLTAKEQAEEKGVADTNLQNAVVRLMSMNVENFFVDPVRSGSCPLFQCRGAQNEAHYITQSRKIYGTIAQVKPAILAIQEMENDPQDIALAQFCSELNQFINDNGVNYTFVKTGRSGTDATKTGIVFDSKQVDPVGPFATLNYQGGSRPSIAQSFLAKGSTDKFTVVANHFKSKLPNGCADDQDCENDNPFGEGAYATVRAAHAVKLRDWMNSDPTSSGSSKIIAFGDFNANRLDRAPQVLVNAGYIDIASRDNTIPYSYQFEGRLGTLDYAFASPSMAAVCQKSAEWHTNSLEPDILGYQNLGVATSVFRSSDHDPLFMSCDFLGGIGPITRSPVTRTPTPAPFAAATRAPQAPPTRPWRAYVNEFHTDNSGADVNEFIEIAVSSSIDPSRVKVELINGADGRPYFSASLSTFTRGTEVACAGKADGETLFYFRNIPAIQNGPDSIAVAVDGILIDHVSYPGNAEFAVVSGIAIGDRPTGVGVSVSYESGFSVSRVGTSSSSTAVTKFQWQSGVTATPGRINSGQNFVCN